MKLRTLTLSIAVALANVGFVSLAHADSASASFTDVIGSGSVSDITATFTLNADGSIGATASSTNGGLVGFAFSSSGNAHYVSQDFSSDASDTSWGTGFGSFSSGWVTNSWPATATSVDWTIGSAGQFSSVSQLFAANGNGYELFAYTNSGTQYGGNAVSAVPEPSTYAMLFAGLACVGWMARRRRS